MEIRNKFQIKKYEYGVFRFTNESTCMWDLLGVFLFRDLEKSAMPLGASNSRSFERWKHPFLP